MEIGAAIYFAIFITVGAFIGINLFVVVVTTNLEQMMKAEEQAQGQQITFSEVREMRRARGSVCMSANLNMCVWRGVSGVWSSKVLLLGGLRAFPVFGLFFCKMGTIVPDRALLRIRWGLICTWYIISTS